MTAFTWNAQEVTRALGMPEATWGHTYAGVSTDTRRLAENDLFVALKGERFDAHDFLADARMANVGGAIVRHGTPRWPGFDWFEVDDTLEAYGRLARHRREQFTGPVVAVTGTNGKTSTKELIAAALAPRFAVHKSDRNLNNLVGVPMTVLAAPVDAGAMVVECGASVRGELARMRDVVRPDIAVVTNVDAGHLEGFGSLEAVLTEKVSLLKGVPVAVVGGRPDTLPARAAEQAGRVITASIEGPGDWTAEAVQLLPDGRPRFTVRGVGIELSLHGSHMVGNALVALAVADVAGVPLAEAAAGLATASIPGGRSEISDIEGVTVLNDCYNANPASLRAALDLLTGMRGTRRAIVVVGTMRELGPESSAMHRAAAEAVLATGPDVVVAVGEFAPAFAALGDEARRPQLISGATPDEVARALKEALRPGDLLLLKASRGVRLETLVPLLWPDHAGTEAH